MLKSAFYTLVFTSAILASCQSATSEEVNSGVERTQQRQEAPLSFRSRTVTRKSSYCNQGPEACATATITYLEALGGEPTLRQSINKYISERIFSLQLDQNPDADTSASEAVAAVKVAEAFVKAQEDFIIEMESIPASAAWELQVEMSAVYQSTSVFTLSVSTYSYAGGAHPNTYLSLQSFDITGKQLTARDMVTDTVQLKQLLEKEFRKVRELGEDAPFAEAGLFIEGNELPLPKQSGLTRNGLKLYYNAYEIGPYAFGPTDLLIPYAQLQDILLKKYKPEQ